MSISTPRPWLISGEEQVGLPGPVENNIWYMLLVFVVVVVVVVVPKVVEFEVEVGVVVLHIYIVEPLEPLGPLHSYHRMM